MFWSKLCKSNWISTWSLVFPLFTLTYCMEYVWKSSLRIGIIISKSYTTIKSTSFSFRIQRFPRPQVAYSNRISPFQTYPDSLYPDRCERGPRILLTDNIQSRSSCGKCENGFFRCATWLQIFQNDSKICEAKVSVTPLINKICKPCRRLNRAPVTHGESLGKPIVSIVFFHMKRNDCPLNYVWRNAFLPC